MERRVFLGAEAADGARRPGVALLRMAYWLYENWRSGPHRNRLHTADCLFCADGRGYRGGPDGSSGQWRGPFDTFEQAEAAGVELPGPTYYCPMCRPDLKGPGP